VHKYLFYICQNYSFEILRPLQQEILAQGNQCAWLYSGGEVNIANFKQDEIVFSKIEQAVDYQPRAVFVPGNYVPNFISGLKVQVFHGLEWKKKGHFSIKGFFDLYCTHGDITTSRFNQLAQKHGYFHVRETGWPKLDPLFQTPAYELDSELPVILFAPTFSPNLTCALACFDEIKKLVNTKKHYWLVKFHPKMNPEWVQMYRKIAADNFKIVDTDSCLPLLQRADIIVSDTSSIIGEFLLLNKPAVTYKNSQPGDYLINIDQPNQLSDAIEKALNSSTDLIKNITQENQALHPYTDGGSSKRILQAVEKLISQPESLAKKKPLNLFRNLKVRKKLNYWKL
jgi:hypothetical protein